MTFFSHSSQVKQPRWLKPASVVFEAHEEDDGSWVAYCLMWPGVMGTGASAELATYSALDDLYERMLFRKNCTLLEVELP